MDYLTCAKPRSNDALSLGERFWKAHYLWLQSKEYQLRPRYAPDWTPSWRGTDKYFLTCEDGVPLVFSQICDATHIPTGMHVALKQWPKKPYYCEEDIHRFLTSDEMLSYPRKHCVPLLDVLARSWNVLLPGLQFLHEHHVPHCDLNINNFMMESPAMVPEGYHPQLKSYELLEFGLMNKLDLSGRAKYFTRTQRPPRYYIIDFGLSRQYDDTETSPRELPVEGGDKTVLEFRDMSELHNPYWTDVYQVLCWKSRSPGFHRSGHPFLPEIYTGYWGFHFLKPLINDMVQNDPSKRPTMNEVVERFQVIVDNTSTWKLRSRPSWRGADIIEEIVLFFSHWKRRVIFILNGTPPIPRPATTHRTALDLHNLPDY